MTAEQWDFDRAEKRPPVKGARSIVSVAFPQRDLQAVCEAAERADLKVSAFIRAAAVRAARTEPHIYSVSGTLGVVPRIAVQSVTGMTMPRARVTITQQEVKP